MNDIITIPNPDLVVTENNKTIWTEADNRRNGFHNLYRTARYVTSFRAARVMPLHKRMDMRIADLDEVRSLTSLPWFSAMVVLRGQDILFERYAHDFGPDRAHSMQSMTKTTMHLVIGQLVERGLIDVSRPVSHYLPEVGSGYATATVQQVLNMDVANDYTEDFADPTSTYYRHEEAMGWRLPRDLRHEETQKSFIAKITSSDTTNRSGHTQYKDANTDVLGWIAERVSGRPLRAFLADIVDAAGIEGSFHITTDREGFPTLDGGGCLTARDLARYFSIFARRGRGVSGEMVGSAAFLEQTLKAGVPMPSPRPWLRYSNQTMVTGNALGHGGWCGQFALANPETGLVGVFFSIVETAHGISGEYTPAVIYMLEKVTGPEFEAEK